MTDRLAGLCRELRMPQSVTEAICQIAPSLDWAALEPGRKCLFRQEQWEEGLSLLKQQLGEDPRGLKMLTCMLVCALDTRESFRRLGISDTVFLDTMDCFPRFVGEHMESFGEYGFDREWWTVRQLSGVLFRIGLLEYELKETEVSLHIPSGTRLEPEAVSGSLDLARQLLAQHFPRWLDLPMVCHSWLLSPTLKELLPPQSNILHFQQRFSVTAQPEQDNDFLVWVFKRSDLPLSQLPERTSLQRSLKAHLLQGGSFTDARGTLIR